jgi:heptosyltransferase III
LDLAFNQLIMYDCKEAPFLIDNFSLGMTAALMKKARLLISVDSMAIHMASAMRLPVVALFGPTNEQVWAPWSVRSTVLALSYNDSPSFSCRPCGQDGCAGSKLSQCLYAIPASKIIDVAYKLLAKKDG